MPKRPGASRTSHETCGLLALLVFVSALLGCSESAPPPFEAPGRVLIVGLDGADPDIVERWMDEGLLPNLSSLAAQGSSGRVESHSPLLSPRIWTSIATGRQPLWHGIDGWVHREGERKGRLFRSDDRKGPALWNIASGRGLRVGVVNWLITQPPEKVNGVLVSDFAIPGERRGWEALGDSFGFDRSLGPDAGGQAITTWPEDWLERVWALSRGDTSADPDFDPRVPFRNDKFVKPLIANAFETDELATRIALEVDRERPDLLMVYLPGIDRVSHFFWGGLEPPESYPEGAQPNEFQRDQWSRILRRYYRYADHLLGQLLAGFGPDDLVIVLSDHGFEAGKDTRKSGDHKSEAAEHGIVLARGPGVPEGGLIEGMSVNDVTPTVLAWLGLPPTRAMDGRAADFVSARALEPISHYDLPPIERVETRAEDIESDVMDQLRTLGYVE